jgi:AbiTii
MSATVKNLQDAVEKGKPSLTQLLGLTSVVAAKLNLEEVVRWVDLELNGFTEDTEPPNYRRVFTQRLEVYNSHHDVWQFAGNLNYALKVRQPVAEIEVLSRKEGIDIPVTKNFSIKNDAGDSFGSDWPQRFVVLGSEYGRILEAVAERWTAELDERGLKLSDAAKFGSFLDAISSANHHSG